MRILIIEDQRMTLWAISEALKTAGLTYDVAKWYTQAEQKIISGQYDLVFLDHRMPREDPGNTEKEDFNRFCDQLENIGYGLVSLIRKHMPNAVIVGTSSLDRDELRRFSIPSITMNKTESFTEIPRVMKEIASI